MVRDRSKYENVIISRKVEEAVLIEKRANVNFHGGEKCSALQATAAKCGMDLVAKMLLEKGADVNAKVVNS